MRIRDRVKRVVRWKALPGWVFAASPYVWKGLEKLYWLVTQVSQVQTSMVIGRWFGRNGPVMLAFFEHWGWIAGIGWLGFLILRPEPKDATTTSPPVGLVEARDAGGFLALDDEAGRHVRRALEQIKAPFAAAVDRAVSALRNHQKNLRDKKHAYRVVAGLFNEPINSLLEAQAEFERTLAALGDARESFLTAYICYQDTCRVINDAQRVYPGDFVDMLRTYWFNDDASLTAAMSTAFSILEFSDLREKIKAYHTGYRFQALYSADFS